MIEVRGLQADYHVLRHGARSIKEYLLSFGGKGLLERKRIIEQVDLDIAAGECFGIVGRNGSGKSTLLRVLAGIVEPTAGSVTVRGRVAPCWRWAWASSPSSTGWRTPGSVRPSWAGTGTRCTARWIMCATSPA
ncbi:MAG: ABC transporter ATP-binding protein [Flavobacteriales bacterium]|nr:ABC transporter ATP-binding protein [Flavobacteriales bacterium]